MAEPLATNAKGHQLGVKQPAGVWSSAVSAVVWSLPQLYLQIGVLRPCVSLINVLVPLMPSGEFAQEPMGGPALQTWLF